MGAAFTLVVAPMLVSTRAKTVEEEKVCIQLQHNPVM